MSFHRILRNWIVKFIKNFNKNRIHKILGKVLTLKTMKINTVKTINKTDFIPTKL